jgi:orotate phosphoribosyltransferase
MIATVRTEMEYRSVADLDDALVSWLPALPREIEVIVGIPRSGLLVANLLALHLNLPLTDVAGLIGGRLLQAGTRWQGAPLDSLLAEPRHVLVVDDSVCSGATVRRTRETIAAAQLPHRITYAAVYMAPDALREGHVDLHRELVPMPRVFEWNLMHCAALANACVDIDGVLCRDPLPAENDDGRRYERFLCDVEPLVIPSHEVGWLVTSRLEKYRRHTEEWLARHGVRYRELRMMDYPSAAARRAAGAYASFKAEVYRATGASLFIESSSVLAPQIASLAGKPVFCSETRELLRAGDVAADARLPMTAQPSPLRRALGALGALRRRVI